MKREEWGVAGTLYFRLRIWRERSVGSSLHFIFQVVDMKRKEPRHIWHLSLGFPLTAHQFLFKRKEKKKEPKVTKIFFWQKYSQSLVHSSNETNIELVQCVGTHYNKSKVHCSWLIACAVLEGSSVEVQLFMDDLKPIRRQYLYSMFMWSTVSYYIVSICHLTNTHNI